MRVRDRGFALMLVLIAVTAVFALAMQGAVSTRTTTLEVGVVHDRVLAEIGARGAAVLALKGLLQADAAVLADAEAEPALGSSASRTPDEQPERPKKPDLPPIVKALLGEKADEIEKGAKDLGRDDALSGLTQGNDLAGRVPKDAGFKVLTTMGLPTRPIEITLDGQLYVVTLSDGASGVSVNTAEDAQLVRYFVAKGCDTRTAQQVTDELLDWRDEDSVPRTLGMEQAGYANRGVMCRNAKFSSLEELLYLPAMTRELFDRCRLDLTLGVDVPVHAPSASRAVLLSVDGVAPTLADAIVGLRQRGGVTKRALEALYPLITAEDLKKRLRFEPSSLVRIMIEASESPMDRRIAEVGARRRGVTRFEGLAIIDERGLKELGLRAVERSVEP